MDEAEATRLHSRFSESVAWLEVIDSNGDPGLGSAFHVGRGVFITARHVVEHGVRRMGLPGENREVTAIDLPLFHPTPEVDIAAIVVPELTPSPIPLERTPLIASRDLVLRRVVIMGYPRIPMAADPPPMVAATGEVNAVVSLYFGADPTLVISPTARGGFSGGLVLSAEGYALGVLTRSLIADAAPTESGFLSASRADAIRVCLRVNGLDPESST